MQGEKRLCEEKMSRNNMPKLLYVEFELVALFLQLLILMTYYQLHSTLSLGMIVNAFLMIRI